ncbi:hypothetical protein D7X12_09010 [Corallococcus sicarius]|uniref:Uncharacterized protein n=1 Tax=Corallococcus sicarius TaxID=2316726 RepID=A0A3A8NZU5_9BACT|nr:hypothetical protein D7X12_09010 [Corallococcus sicarius]
MLLLLRLTSLELLRAGFLRRRFRALYGVNFAPFEAPSLIIVQADRGATAMRRRLRPRQRRHWVQPQSIHIAQPTTLTREPQREGGLLRPRDS